MEEPIRVLQVVSYMDRGGIETMLMNYYRNIDRSKIQFDFIVHRDFRADYDDEIESLGGKIYRLPRLIPWGIEYNCALNSFFREHPEYKIVHSHLNDLSSVQLRAAMRNGVPVRISHSHTSDESLSIKVLIKMFYRMLIPKYATKLFACSKAAGEWMFQGEPFELMANAIDIKSFAYSEEKAIKIRRELGIDSNAFVIGNVGRMTGPKNQQFLVDVLTELVKKDSNAVLMLVGEGDHEDKLRNKAKTLGIEDKVIFTGVRGDVPELMSAMDVFAFPSLFEGLGIVAVEAQASGLPCVISDCIPKDCDITDLVTRVSLEKSAEEWADVILAQKNTVRRNTYNEIAAAGFDIKENAKKLSEFYLGALDNE